MYTMLPGIGFQTNGNRSLLGHHTVEPVFLAPANASQGNHEFVISVQPRADQINTTVPCCSQNNLQHS